MFFKSLLLKDYRLAFIIILISIGELFDRISCQILLEFDSLLLISQNTAICRFNECQFCGDFPCRLWLRWRTSKKLQFWLPYLFYAFFMSLSLCVTQF